MWRSGGHVPSLGTSARSSRAIAIFARAPSTTWAKVADMPVASERHSTAVEIDDVVGPDASADHRQGLGRRGGRALKTDSSSREKAADLRTPSSSALDRTEG